MTDKTLLEAVLDGRENVARVNHPGCVVLKEFSGTYGVIKVYEDNDLSHIEYVLDESIFAQPRMRTVVADSARKVYTRVFLPESVEKVARLLKGDFHRTFGVGVDFALFDEQAGVRNIKY